MPFTAQRISRTQIIQLSAPVNHVFPLFEPIGEKQWAEGWEPEMIYPVSGDTEEGAVFMTGSHEATHTIWTILTYNPAKAHISYLRVTPDSHIGMVDVRCEDALHEITRTSVTYTLTALTEQGNDYIAGFTAEHYQAWISSWETAINYYLRSGHLLQHH